MNEHDFAKHSTSSNQLQFAFNYSPLFLWILAILLLIMIPSANAEPTIVPGVLFAMGMISLTGGLGLGLEREAKVQHDGESISRSQTVLLVIGVASVLLGAIYVVIQPVMALNVAFVYAGAVGSYAVHLGLGFGRYFSYLSMDRRVYLRGLAVNLGFLLLLTFMLVFILL